MSIQHLRVIDEGDVERLRRAHLSHEVSALQATVENLTRLVVAMQGHVVPTSPGGGSDLLYGVSLISAFLGMTDAQVYHLHARGQIPTFKIGKKVCARRSALSAWLVAKEVGQ